MAFMYQVKLENKTLRVTARLKGAKHQEKEKRYVQESIRA